MLIVPLKFIVRVERFLTKLIFLEQNQYKSVHQCCETKERLVMLNEEIKTEKEKEER